MFATVVKNKKFVPSFDYDSCGSHVPSSANSVEKSLDTPVGILYLPSAVTALFRHEDSWNLRCN